MDFEWDENKNRINKAKHRISFESARSVFFDLFAVFVQDRYVDGEERWQVTGVADGIQVIVVAHTYRGEQNGEEIIRIISARPAERAERRDYDRTRLGQN